MTDLAIETTGLVKAFGGTRAVDGIDLRVPRGGVHGFLGPNGAGKTTVIRMLATLLRPDAGSARVLGLDVVRDADEVRSRVALTGQFASVDEDLTGRENLVLVARLLGYSRPGARARTAELLDAFGLDDAADRLVKKYSGGMRRRIDIAASIVVTPELVFLDEPTTGLDPRSRNQVWDIVRAMVAAGTTVLLTTQYLDEADQLADRISVIDEGRVIAEGTPVSSRRPSAPARCTCACTTPPTAPRPRTCSAGCWAPRCARAPTRWRCPPRWTRRRRRCGRSRRSGTPGSTSPTSPSASRAWTRSSWPSPGARPSPSPTGTPRPRRLSDDPRPRHRTRCHRDRCDRGDRLRRHRTCSDRGARRARVRTPSTTAQALTTSVAFGWRALLKIKHVPEQLFDVTAFPIMMTLLFTFLFGGALAGSPGSTSSSCSPGRWCRASS
ncbi:ATP-binding cassette domain-containing protein [Cellulomonas sp. ATA003]|nr:ATP-binding cassette domain-containing protein [Cellulomonas sp. ATA003]WNB86633.1 ATP-binding cassette domain-containing protein [Cellulomonas sp. ATA003]